MLAGSMEAVILCNEQIHRFAEVLRRDSSCQPFRFVSEEVANPKLFPPVDADGVVDLFFFAVAHQFGFWEVRGDRYDQPMVAQVDGVACKGSDFVWRCVTRAWESDASFFAVNRLARLGPGDWARVFEDDEGRNPLPMWLEHLEIIMDYGAWWQLSESTPSELLLSWDGSRGVLADFLKRAGRVPGYREDPLRKKLMLLAMVLANRPEAFLAVDDPDAFDPVIDYHLMRSALRTGLVVVKDPGLREALAARQLVSEPEESAVRAKVFEAIEAMRIHSGVSHAAMDFFFFQNRTRCPEMTEPDCGSCPVQEVCMQRKELFQPVRRTTYY